VNAARRTLAASGAVCCAAAIALAAAAMHGLAGHEATQAALAAAFAFAHGLALLVLAPATTSRLRLAALVTIAVGMVLFAGTLSAAALAGMPTGAAPAGGVLLMLGWLVLAVDAAAG
jgi:uncharacterized membrane protein YgdD (TMEM256/DUF423 family)